MAVAVAGGRAAVPPGFGHPRASSRPPRRGRGGRGAHPWLETPSSHDTNLAALQREEGFLTPVWSLGQCHPTTSLLWGGGSRGWALGVADQRSHPFAIRPSWVPLWTTGSLGWSLESCRAGAEYQLTRALCTTRSAPQQPHRDFLANPPRVKRNVWQNPDSPRLDPTSPGEEFSVCWPLFSLNKRQKLWSL